MRQPITHPIEPPLIETMTRGFERQMRCSIGGEPVENAMQGHRIRGRQPRLSAFPAGNKAERSKACRPVTEVSKNLLGKACN